MHTHWMYSYLRLWGDKRIPSSLDWIQRSFQRWDCHLILDRKILKMTPDNRRNEVSVDDFLHLLVGMFFVINREHKPSELLDYWIRREG